MDLGAALRRTGEKVKEEKERLGWLMKEIQELKDRMPLGLVSGPSASLGSAEGAQWFSVHTWFELNLHRKACLQLQTHILSSFK